MPPSTEELHVSPIVSFPCLPSHRVEIYKAFANMTVIPDKKSTCVKSNTRKKLQKL